MAEFKKSTEGHDYKELFEFRLTVGENIICQRYFKINNFNVECLRSYELADAIRRCAATIDRDLKQKTQVYLEMTAPRYFNSVEQMMEITSRPEVKEDLRLGEGLVVVGSNVNYFWNGNEPQESQFKFDEGELYSGLTEEDRVSYKFSFLIDGKDVCSTIWEGIYPKYVRNSIDLSNKRGRFEGEDLTRLSFEQYVLYKMVEGRKDLVWGLIKDICVVCSFENKKDYTTVADYGESEKYGKKLYKNALLRAINQFGYQLVCDDRGNERVVKVYDPEKRPFKKAAEKKTDEVAD